MGSAERRLREQCTTGDIRSIRFTYSHDESSVAVEDFLEDPELIKPGEWSKDEVDFKAEDKPDSQVCIGVSEDDVIHWLIEQPRPVANAKAVKGGKIPRIKVKLAELYPKGVPEPGLCPRKELQNTLIKRDKSLAPLDLATLKTAIDDYNRSIGNSPKPS
jgi:hypothetical protein